MNKYKAFLLSTVVTFFHGCSAIDQHPLIYGSKNTFGFNVSTGTNEPADFTVGFKSSDFAYVPTTVIMKQGDVSKPIASIRGCSGESQKIVEDTTNSTKTTTITGGCTELVYSDASTVDGLLLKANKEFDDFKKGLTEELKSKFGNGTNKPAKAEVTNEISSFMNDLTFEQDFVTAFAPHITGLATKVSQKDPSQVSQEVKAYFDGIDKEKLIETLIDPTVLNYGSSTNQDSLSVFGSFASRGSASTGVEGSVSLGKIFSTGVASQKLAESVGKSGSSMEKIKEQFQNKMACVEKMQLIFPKEEQADKLVEALKLCD